MSALAVIEQNEVLDVGQLTLAELAENANRECATVESSLAAAVYAAIRAGRFLREAHDRVVASSPGAWNTWVEENVDINVAGAGQFMRLAAYETQLPREAFEPFRDTNGRLRLPTPARAMNYVRGLPALPRYNHKTLPSGLRDEAKRLRAEGVTIAETARLLGVAEGSVKNWTIPGYQQRAAKQARKRKRERDLAARALEKQREVAAAKAAGGDLGEIYSLLRKAADCAGRAEATLTGETRVAVRDALTQIHKAEDNIGRAIRRSVSRGRASKLEAKAA